MGLECVNTHLDQLGDKLKELRVRRVISKMLADTTEEDSTIPEDDLQYVEDLGLVCTRPQLAIANPIYREVIPRALTWTTQVLIPQETAWYVKEDGSLDMPKLLNGFQQFFRENGDIWSERFDYKEAGPQLLMQSFLQRIVNGGGRIEREYGLGRRRTDLLIQWPLDKTQGFYGPVQRVVIELKIQHKSLEATLSEGLAQTDDYMDRVGTEEGYLIIFNRNPDTTGSIRSSPEKSCLKSAMENTESACGGCDDSAMPGKVGTGHYPPIQEPSAYTFSVPRRKWPTSLPERTLGTASGFRRGWTSASFRLIFGVRRGEKGGMQGAQART